MRNKNLMLTSLLALGIGLGTSFAPAQSGTISAPRKTRREIEDENRNHADNVTALRNAEEKRKRKNAKRLANFNKQFSPDGRKP